MNANHPIMSDLIARADYQQRIAEGDAARRAAGITGAPRPGAPILGTVSASVGRAFVRTGLRLQGTARAEPAAALPLATPSSRPA